MQNRRLVVRAFSHELEDLVEITVEATDRLGRWVTVFDLQYTARADSNSLVLDWVRDILSGVLENT